MKYIFKKGSSMIGVVPIESFQICCYENGECFDEHFKDPENFCANDIMFVENEDNANDAIKYKVFVNLFDGRRYQILLNEINGEDDETIH